MGTLAAFYASAAAAPAGDQRRYAVGAAYKLAEMVNLGYPIATARTAILSLPQYANALNAAGLTASFNTTTTAGTAVPTVHDTATGTVSAGTVVTIPKPALTAPGDFLIAAVADRGTNTDTVTPPSGWASLTSQARGSVGVLSVFTKVAAGEPASYDFTCSASSTNAGTIIAVSGANTTPDAVAGGAGTVATGLHTTPAVTTDVDNCLLLRIVATAVGTLPLSWTWTINEIVDFNSVGTGAGGISAATETLATAGASGTRDATFAQSSSTTYAAVTVALAPA